MKTYKVIDLVIDSDFTKDNIVHTGTHKECIDFRDKNKFEYLVVPMTKEEIKIHNIS